MSAEPVIELESVSYSFGQGALEKQILFDITTTIKVTIMSLSTWRISAHCATNGS